MILAAVREAAAQNLDADVPRPLREVAREALEFALRGVLMQTGQRTSTSSTSNTSGPAGAPPSGESP